MSSIKLTNPKTEKEYTLEFNRRVVRMMEAQGFKAREIEDKPLTLLPELFAMSFKMHHPTLSSAEIEEMYEAIPDKEDFIGALAELYAEPIEALMAEPKKGKNVKWTRVK